MFRQSYLSNNSSQNFENLWKYTKYIANAKSYLRSDIVEFTLMELIFKQYSIRNTPACKSNIILIKLSLVKKIEPSNQGEWES